MSCVMSIVFYFLPVSSAHELGFLSILAKTHYVWLCCFALAFCLLSLVAYVGLEHPSYVRQTLNP